MQNLDSDSFSSLKFFCAILAFLDLRAILYVKANECIIGGHTQWAEK